MKAILDYLGLVLATLLLIAAVLGVMSAPTYAEGQSGQCAPFASVVEQLADKWAEGPIGRGLASGGAYVVTLFSDAAGDTFTVVGVTADGTACILATGTGWESVQPAPLGTEG